MTEHDKCIFCGKLGASTFYKEKPMCSPCFREIFEWAQHGEILKRVEKIEEAIYQAITETSDIWIKSKE